MTTKHLPLVKADLILKTAATAPVAVEHAAHAATCVTPRTGTVVPPSAGHDIAKLDSARLTVPETDAKEDEEHAAKGNRQSDGHIAVLKAMRLLRAGVAMLVKVERDGLGGGSEVGGELCM